MPEGVKDVFDIKTIIMTALLAGSNLGTYLGIAAPAQRVTAETMSAAEITKSALDQAYARIDDLTARLAACVESCQ